MTTWAELRTVALIGTERRALPGPVESSFLEPAGESADPTHVENPERAALRAAAIMGVARRAGAPVIQTTVPAAARESAGSEPERFAPAGAVQLLELMLTGSAGPGKASDSLFLQWFDRCIEQGYVVPHRLLVMMLDHATKADYLQTKAAAVLGSRGQWLAAQRDKWSWLAATMIKTASTSTLPSVEIDALLELPADERDATIAAIRKADPAAGRELIGEACARLDAASRARVLRLLYPQLNPDDEDILEAALDDRGKAVRAVGIELLNSLTSSARALRLASQLELLVQRTGMLRKMIEITYPSPPEGEQLRDLSPDPGEVIEQQWFDTIVVGAPLTGWEDMLGLPADKIINSNLSHPSELMRAWTKAAIAQDNQTWIEALFAKAQDPELLPFVTPATAAEAFLARAKAHEKNPPANPKRSKDKNLVDQVVLREEHKLAALLSGLPGPWDVAFSTHVIGWVREAPDNNLARVRLQLSHTVLSQRLAPETQPKLEHWLDNVRGGRDKAVEQLLRELIQQLSFRTSIDKAFV